MDRIPLINPKLVKVSSTIEKAPTPILRAEVVSSTLVKESAAKQPVTQTKEPAENQTKDTPKTNTQEYKILLKIGQQQLETLSNIELKKGSQIEVKVLPGPELKIINSDQKPGLIQPTPTVSTPQASILVQQLLADRIPQIQQQDVAQLIKQLGQIINTPLNSSQGTSSPELKATELKAATLQPPDPTFPAAKPTTQQSLANQLYQQQGKLITTEANTSPKAAVPDSALLQVKTWLQQLPQSQDISTATGLRNALNNAGVQAETQLSNLAQQALSFNNKSNANSIFQQLQKLQQGLQQKLAPEPNQIQSSQQTKDPSQIKEQAIDLTSIVKRTAKVLSDNTQSVLSGLVKSTKPSTQQLSTQQFSTQQASNPSSAITAISTTASIPATTSQFGLAPSNWQNPQLNHSFMNLDELLQAPLLQNPSSNNKFALSQILTNQGQQDDALLRTPLNWPERTGSDAVLIRNLQNLLGHIEREQVQQMQSAEASQSNNPNQLQQNQQWLPLLINHQQQLQLIEFYIDKEERLNQAGEKKNHWFINLHFDLPKLGKLGIEIAMLDNECNTTFWSESSSTLNQLSQHIQPLRQRLTEQGIIVSDIQSRHGTLEKRKHNIQQRLVDVKT